MGCSLWGELREWESWGVYIGWLGRIFVAIMFYIYIITLLLSLSMLKHPNMRIIEFSLRGVESESAGEFGERCREVLRGVVDRGI